MIKDVKKSYDLGSKAYGSDWTSPYPWLEAERTYFGEKLKPGALIVDVGCNIGTDCAYWKQRGFDVVGVDISSTALQIARKTHPEIDFLESNILELTQLNRKFDGVWAAFSFLHLPRDQFKTGLEQVRGILKNEGIFFLGMALGLVPSSVETLG